MPLSLPPSPPLSPSRCTRPPPSPVRRPTSSPRCPCRRRQQRRRGLAGLRAKLSSKFCVHTSAITSRSQTKPNRPLHQEDLCALTCGPDRILVRRCSQLEQCLAWLKNGSMIQYLCARRRDQRRGTSWGGRKMGRQETKEAGPDLTLGPVPDSNARSACHNSNRQTRSDWTFRGGSNVCQSRAIAPHVGLHDEWATDASAGHPGAPGTTLGG